MIRIVIEIAQHHGEGAGVTITTDPFDPTKEHAAVGACWVGVCNTLNAYMRANGAPSFDCMTMRAVQ